MSLDLYYIAILSKSLLVHYTIIHSISSPKKKFSPSKTRLSCSGLISDLQLLLTMHSLL